MKSHIHKQLTHLIHRDTTRTTFTTHLLYACSHIYSVGTRAHALLYERNILTRKSLPLPTISVGNFAVGGTGKTPIVQHLAQLVLEQGGIPLVLSRGYGADEQYQLDARLRPMGAVLGFGANRHAAAEKVMSQQQNKIPTTAILDDGLQHWSLTRDFNVVVVNAYDPWGGNNILPLGRLRESPKDGLGRADLVIIHNVTDRVPEANRTAIHNEIQQYVRDHHTNDDDNGDGTGDGISTRVRVGRARVPIVETCVVPSSLFVYDRQKKELVEKDLNELKGLNVLAISGIGCPSSFEDMLLDQLHVKSVDSQVFPDHHVYTSHEVNNLLQRTKHACAIPIITEKDYYRCASGAASVGDVRLLDHLEPFVVTTKVELVTPLLSDADADEGSNKDGEDGEDGEDDEDDEEDEEDGNIVLLRALKIADQRHLLRRRRDNNLQQRQQQQQQPQQRCFSSTTTICSTATASTPLATFHHVPVLPQETMLHWYPPQHLLENKNKVCLMVDVTAGGGSHSEAMLAATPDHVKLLVVDRDANAVQECKRRLERFEHRVLYAQASFSTLQAILIQQEDVAQCLQQAGGTVASVLADLGCSSHQLDTAQRGFSFRRDGPLDMRMYQSDCEPGCEPGCVKNDKEKNKTNKTNKENEMTAADLINRLSERALVRVFQEFGEVPTAQANRVARLICAARPLTTTEELVAVIIGSENAHKHYKKSPATKFFQSLRIAVNDELGELDALLGVVPDLLTPGGTFVVISFHSLEDRRVKVRFKELAKSTSKLKLKSKVDSSFQLITRKPIVATKEEIDSNPRARSSRLRVLKKKRLET